MLVFSLSRASTASFELASRVKRVICVLISQDVDFAAVSRRSSFTCSTLLCAPPRGQFASFLKLTKLTKASLCLKCSGRLCLNVSLVLFDDNCVGKTHCRGYVVHPKRLRQFSAKLFTLTYWFLSSVEWVWKNSQASVELTQNDGFNLTQLSFEMQTKILNFQKISKNFSTTLFIVIRTV